VGHLWQGRCDVAQWGQAGRWLCVLGIDVSVHGEVVATTAKMR